MKKPNLIMKAIYCIFSILLAFAPYIYLFLVCFVFTLKFPLSTDSIKQIFLPYFIVAAITCIPNCIFAFTAPKINIPATQLAFWNMFVKLIHIPFYLAAFILAAALAIGLLLFGGLILAAIIAFMVYLFLLTSSKFGLSALKQAEKNKLLDSQFVRKHTTYHYIFGLDIISAVMLYKKLKQTATAE